MARCLHRLAVHGQAIRIRFGDGSLPRCGRRRRDLDARRQLRPGSRADRARQPRRADRPRGPASPAGFGVLNPARSAPPIRDRSGPLSRVVTCLGGSPIRPGRSGWPGCCRARRGRGRARTLAAASSAVARPAARMPGAGGGGAAGRRRTGRRTALGPALSVGALLKDAGGLSLGSLGQYAVARLRAMRGARCRHSIFRDAASGRGGCRCRARSRFCVGPVRGARHPLLSFRPEPMSSPALQLFRVASILSSI